ncbi:MAG: DinB family protein [Candidatus Kariarchaeaceae archaeon]
MLIENIATYQKWAGNKIRSVLQELNEDDFNQALSEPFKEPYNTLRELCMHIVLALETCFIVVNQVTNKNESNKFYVKVFSCSNDELLTRWNVLDAKLAEAIKEKKEGVVEIFHFSEPFEIPLADFYFQYVNHTTYHRGQVILALSKLGKKTIGTDYLFMFKETAN